MAPSVTQACIRDVSIALLQDFRPHGFRRRAPHLWRTSGDVIHAVNFQASQWGSATEGSFTINLAVSHPELYSIWTGRRFPANPGTATWPIQVRIGSLDDDRDIWWKVDAATDAKRLAAEVKERFQGEILAWFEPYLSLVAIDERLTDSDESLIRIGVVQAQRPVIRAIIKSVLGDKEGAKRCINQALVDSEGSGFQAAVCKIAGRLGLNVA